MILHPVERGMVAIPQSAHAFLAYQVADHWGNRTTPRPSPRAEVLAGVMLHDIGWDGREDPPRLGPSGLPIAFDTLPEAEREALWTAAVERAALRGRYVAYLVSHHVSMLATLHARQGHPEFLSREEARRARLRAELAADTRYAAAFRGRNDEVNRAVVRLADEIGVQLSRGGGGRLALHALPQREGAVTGWLEAVGARVYRLRPWPLIGRRLDLHAEGRLLAGARFADETELRAAWAAAPQVRLSWTLLAPGTARD
ncbi:MAG TPA: DUF3891 family protein [Thermoanaerobaculaceae bacterium]|nr:DUF3891 family protein [Thermoanaerobaculaceae bacterium]